LIIKLGFSIDFYESNDYYSDYPPYLVEYLEWLMYWCILWCYFPSTGGCDLLSYYAMQILFGMDKTVTMAGNYYSISRQISLQSLNALLTASLSLIRPFVSVQVYECVYNAFYQLLITFVCAFIAPRLGCYLLGYLLAIYVSFTVLHTYNCYNIELKRMYALAQPSPKKNINFPILPSSLADNIQKNNYLKKEYIVHPTKEPVQSPSSHEIKEKNKPMQNRNNVFYAKDVNPNYKQNHQLSPIEPINDKNPSRLSTTTTYSSFWSNIINGMKEWRIKDVLKEPFKKEKKNRKF